MTSNIHTLHILCSCHVILSCDCIWCMILIKSVTELVLCQFLLVEPCMTVRHGYKWWQWLTANNNA